MNYRKVKCTYYHTGKLAGYLGTSGNYVNIITSLPDTSMAACKWDRINGELYLAKATEPQERWLGRDGGMYATWGLWDGTYYEPVVFNADKTVSLKAMPGRYLYCDTNNKNLVSWTDDFKNESILRINLLDLRMWLKELPDSTSLSDINIPGTHDSAAINTTIRTLYSCQDKSITDQLNDGIRLLDVRLKINKEGTPPNYSFDTCHGNIGLGIELHVFQTFSSLLQECKDFLVANPSEFVAMSIKFDDRTEVEDAEIAAALQSLSALIGQYPTMTLENIPKLGQARGHIWLLDRITPDLLKNNIAGISSFKFGPPLDVPDNPTGTLLPKVNGRPNFPVYMQDRYKNLASHDPERNKYDLFRAAITQKPADGLLINFASATKLPLAGVYIEDDLIKYLHQDRPRSLGWGLFDYYEKSKDTDDGHLSCAELFIASNFNYDTI